MDWLLVYCLPTNLSHVRQASVKSNKNLQYYYACHHPIQFIFNPLSDQIRELETQQITQKHHKSTTNRRYRAQTFEFEHKFSTAVEKSTVCALFVPCL